MATVGQVWRAAQARLEASGINPGPREGKELLARILDISPLNIITCENDAVEPAEEKVLDGWVARRAGGEPLAYILGYAGFFGRDWAVGPGVLVPRHDTETLVQAVLEGGVFEGLVGEIGVGSGAILGTLLAERGHIKGVAVEADPVARDYAERNLARYGMDHRVTWADHVDDLAAMAPFAALVSNPPYIADAEWAALEPGVRDFEPQMALVGDAPNEDGLRYYRAWVPLCADLLAPGGLLAMEMGWQQAEAVKNLFEAAGLTHVRVVQDLGGRDRVVVGVR